ncbi:tandem-95 repeat protein [Colwellia sp. MSW7]|uniref:Tandem-95 repeat protein n=1 Tax=Colwellia maritima TaxID=2912588 RepID=A0ABS9X6H4_9GAMM|nr:tandem-95 repeat protein [Colwellia maritima]MCI2285845.1 tandem-95 repeat protein [Colwellia maritima]
MHSTAGEQGYCPPPTSTQWTPGLTEGHWCVQLTIEDGGANDNDNLANGTIVDPGGVSVIVTDNTMPVAMTDDARVKRDDTLLIDVLINDTDADGDSLSIGVATATFGTVTIESDNQLSYITKADFVGEDTIIYSVSDGKGGTSSAQVNITVYANEAPQAVDDIANTDDRRAITIDVLANDSDTDEDELSVTATVDNGTVNINDDSTLTYTPTVGFSGTAIISYTVDDGEGDEATAQVEVTVVAYQAATVTNKSSGGGSMGMLFFGLLGLVVSYRTYKKHARNSSLLLAALIAMVSSANVNATEFDWFVTASAGQSSAKANQPNITEVEALSWDDKDTSYSLGGGLEYGDFAFILSYENLGEASASYTGKVLDPASFHQGLAESAPKLVDGFSLQSQYNLWQKEAINISFGLGLLAWDLDYTSDRSESVIELNDSDVDVFYLLQLGYKLSEHTQLSIKATRYNLSINDVNNIAVALSYHF